MLVAFVPTRALVTALTTEMGVDGGYYLDIAMHVRDGDGLVSDVSLYHSGFPSFPHATPIYPLWPWLLGLTGRVVDITVAAHWLPFALWLGALAGAWALGRRLLASGLLGIPWLHGGHLFLLTVGTQRELARFINRPYTEGVSYAVLFAALWRLSQLRPRLRDGVELGLWMSLVCLCRSQLFILPIAFGCGLSVVALLGGRAGRRWLAPGALALSLVAVTLGVWWWSVRSFLPDAPPLVLLRFDQAQVSDVLAPIDLMVDTDGLAGFVLDRLGGVVVAYDVTDWFLSYGAGFFALHFALPLAVLAGLGPALRLRPADVRRALAQPQALLWAVLVFFSLGALASVHLPHKQDFGEWYFHRRHAVVNLLPFTLCLLGLLRHRWLRVRQLAVGLIAVQLVLFVEGDVHEVEEAYEGPSEVLMKRDEALLAWLRERASAEDPLTVAMWAFKPPHYAWQTDHVGYHWFYKRTSHEDLVKMFDELGAEVLIIHHYDTRRWDFRADDARFMATWEELRPPPLGRRVYRRRRQPAVR